MSLPDYYSTLGVASTATNRQIRLAFRRLARSLHPDVNRHDPDAERRFARIANAYRVLGDERRRRLYDERRRRGRFAGPDSDQPASFRLDDGSRYHSDLGHYSDFYGAGDPLTVRDAAELVARSPAWLRRAIREGRLAATRGRAGYILRRRDVERLDRSARRWTKRRDAAADERQGSRGG